MATSARHVVGLQDPPKNTSGVFTPVSSSFGNVREGFCSINSLSGVANLGGGVFDRLPLCLQLVNVEVLKSKAFGLIIFLTKSSQVYFLLGKLIKKKITRTVLSSSYFSDAANVKMLLRG